MPRDTRADQPKRLGGTARLDIVVLCAVVALGAAVLAVFAWNRPATASSTLGYHQSGSLAYSAPASPTSIYGKAGVQTGQPVYVELVPTLGLTYTYRFSSSAPATLQGTEQLVATLSEGAAFTRTVPLQPPTPFKGDKFTTKVTLHFATFQAMAAVFNNFTGDNANTYSLSIAPHVTVKGQLGAAPVKTDFNQPTRFGFDETAMTPPSSTQGSSSGGATADGIGRAITSATSGSVRIASAGQATLFAGLSVYDARLISFVVLVVALAVGAWLGWPLLQEALSDDERVRIATRMSAGLVEVTSLPRTAGAVVELRSFEGLEQVSRKLECPLLHLQSEAGDEYAVVDNGTVYVYRIVDQPPQRLGRVLPASSESPRHAVRGRDSTGAS